MKEIINIDTLEKNIENITCCMLNDLFNIKHDDITRFCINSSIDHKFTKTHFDSIFESITKQIIAKFLLSDIEITLQEKLDMLFYESDNFRTIIENYFNEPNNSINKKLYNKFIKNYIKESKIYFDNFPYQDSNTAINKYHEIKKSALNNFFMILFNREPIEELEDLMCAFLSERINQYCLDKNIKIIDSKEQYKEIYQWLNPCKRKKVFKC